MKDLISTQLVRYLEARGVEHVFGLCGHTNIAVLSAMVEDMQVKWLRGERVDPAAIATLLNARRREAEIVGIDPLPKDVTPDLKTYLDARAEPPGEAD